jgi:hypothetical protein
VPAAAQARLRYAALKVMARRVTRERIRRTVSSSQLSSEAPVGVRLEVGGIDAVAAWQGRRPARQGLPHFEASDMTTF